MAEERADEVVAALEALSHAIERNGRDEQLLRERIDALCQARRSGTDVTAALRQEPSPGTMQLLGGVLSRLMESSGHVRRGLAHSMRAEGTSIPAIARVFGVTHQRVSNILNRPTADAGALHDAGASSATAAPEDQGEDDGCEQTG